MIFQRIAVRFGKSSPRKFLVVLTGVICLLHSASHSTHAAGPDRPHIIIVYTDDMGVGDLGCYGGTLVPTPHIDRMAAEGTRFTQFYVAAPICSASRAGLITGRFSADCRITSYLQTRKGNRGCQQADFLSTDLPALPRQLQAAGYATAHFGKWHLGGGRDVDNAPKFAAYGYDEHAGTWESPEPDPQITASDWIWSDKDPVKRWDRSGYFVDKTLDFLKRHHGDQPCFVNLWPDDVHTPWVPSDEAPKGNSPKNLGPVLEEYDRQLGRLLQGLADLGIDEQTLVIFTSDNGPLPTFKGDRSAPYRSGKISLYEGGIRMPLIVRWPGHVPAGRVDSQSILSAVDWFPTLCTLAEAEVPDDSLQQGENIQSVVLGTPREQRERPLMWEYGRNEKFFAYPSRPGDRSPSLALRDGPWKLLMNPDKTRTELYNVVEDPSEQTNLADQHPKIVADFQQQLLDWRSQWPNLE